MLLININELFTQWIWHTKKLISLMMHILHFLVWFITYYDAKIIYIGYVRL